MTATNNTVTHRDFTTTPLTLAEEIATLDDLLRAAADRAKRMPAARYTAMVGALIARKAQLCRQRDANERIAHDGEEQWQA